MNLQLISANKLSGPKIVQSSCGNFSIKENQLISNLLRVFAFNDALKETETELLFYNLESNYFF